MSKSYGTISAKRKIGPSLGFVKKTSLANLAWQAFGIGVSLFGGDVVDAFVNPTKTGEEADLEVPVMSKEDYEKMIKRDRAERDSNPEIQVLVDPRSMTGNQTTDATSGNSVNTSINTTQKTTTTVNDEIISMLSGANLSNDDNDINTIYLYDLYFIQDMKERTLKRYPTIRNYQNAYSFASMLKEKQEEQTFEEIVMICFYFRMV